MTSGAAPAPPGRRRPPRPGRFAAASLLAAAVSGCAGGGAENELVVAAPPGRIADLEERFAPAFEEATGTRIVPVGLRSGEQVARVRIERGNPSLDLLWIDAGEAALLAREGLLRPPSAIRAPHLDALGPAEGSGALPPTFSSAVGFLYNTDALPEPPRSWAALFDPALADRLALFHFGSTLGPLTVATLAHLETGDGTDADAGFARLAELRPNVLDFGGSGPANNRLVAQGEAWLTLGLPAQARHLREAGAPVGWVAPAEGAIALPQGIQVVAGTRRAALADAFVDHLFSPGMQAVAARVLELVPARPEVPLPAGLPAPDSLLRLDLRAIGRLRPEWAARFRREILGE